MTPFRDEFKTKGRGRRVESSCTRGSTFGLKYSCKWYENVKTRRVDVVLEVACGTRGVARVAKRTRMSFRAENEGATKKTSQRFPTN